MHYARRDDDDVHPSESLSEVVTKVSRARRRCVTVGEISSNSRRALNVVHAKVGYARVELEQKRHGLPNATRGAQHRNILAGLRKE